MVMDTLRAAVRHLAAASLDHTGRRLHGRRDRAVRAELHSGWDYRRLCSGLAADRGGVVCAADGVETNKIIIMQKAGLQSHFLLEITALLICADIFYENVLSFYIRLRKDAGGKAFCFV